MNEPIDPIAERYGRKSPSKGRIIALASILTALFLTWAIWVTVTGNKPVSKTLAYEVIDQNHTKVTFNVSKPAERQVKCAIKALKQDYGIVGYKELEIPVGVSSFTVDVTLRTTELAVTGLVDHCWFY